MGREVAVEQFNKALQGVRDCIDNNYQAVQGGAQIAMKHVEDAKKAVDKERMERLALERQHTLDTQVMGDRIDEMSGVLRTAMQEYSRRFEKYTLECSEMIHDYGRASQKSRAETEVSAVEANARILDVEDKLASLEGRLLATQQKHSVDIERVNERSDKATKLMESLKVEGGNQGHSLDAIIMRLTELQDAVAQNEQELRGIAEHERKAREDEMTTLRASILSEQELVLSDIEGKLISRLTQESTTREESFSTLMDNMHQTIRQSIKLNGRDRALSKVRDADIVDEKKDVPSAQEGVQITPQSPDAPSKQEGKSTASQSATVVSIAQAAPKAISFSASVPSVQQPFLQANLPPGRPPMSLQSGSPQQSVLSQSMRSANGPSTQWRGMPQEQCPPQGFPSQNIPSQNIVSMTQSVPSQCVPARIVRPVMCSRPPVG